MLDAAHSQRAENQDNEDTLLSPVELATFKSLRTASSAVYTVSNTQKQSSHPALGGTAEHSRF